MLHSCCRTLQEMKMLRMKGTGLLSSFTATQWSRVVDAFKLEGPDTDDLDSRKAYQMRVYQELERLSDDSKVVPLVGRLVQMALTGTWTTSFNKDKLALLPGNLVEFHKDMDDETKLVFWDTAGQERFQSLMSSYYRDAHAIMFVYDVTDRHSFFNLEQWWREYLAYGDANNCAAMLVGNKTDLTRVVDKKEATAWAVRKGISYSELSSKDDRNVTATFDTLVQKLKTLPTVRKEKVRYRATPKHDRCCY